MLRIKKILKVNPFVLAPMHGITDAAFRLLCEKYKASFSFSEMHSADAVVRGVLPKKKKGLDFVQLFGNENSPFRKAIETLDCDLIDINLGCPSPRTLNFKAGAYLLKHPNKIKKIFSEITKTDKPISAKIRLGFDKDNSLEIAKILEDYGIEFLTIHGRLAKQGYSGKADWSKIKKIAEKTNLVVIGNGNIEGKKNLNKLSFVQGLMIGRKAIGNPQIFEKMFCFWKNLDFKEKNKRELFREYLKIAKKEKIEFKRIKQQAVYFTKNQTGGKKQRKAIMQAKTITDILQIFI